MESIWYQCKHIFATQPHLGVIVDDAHLLFANKKPRAIIKILYEMTNMAQSAERQFLLVGNSELLECANAVRNYQGKQPYDRGWLLARMRLIDRN
jgi:hypothetical protein